MWGSSQLGSWGHGLLVWVWGSPFILVINFCTLSVPPIHLCFCLSGSLSPTNLTQRQIRLFFSWNKGKHDTNVTVREQLCLFCLSLTIDSYIPDLIWLSSSGLLLSTVYNSPPFCLGPAWNSKYVLEGVEAESSFGCILLWGRKK